MDLALLLSGLVSSRAELLRPDVRCGLGSISGGFVSLQTPQKRSLGSFRVRWLQLVGFGELKPGFLFVGVSFLGLPGPPNGGVGRVLRSGSRGSMEIFGLCIVCLGLGTWGCGTPEKEYGLVFEPPPRFS